MGPGPAGQASLTSRLRKVGQLVGRHTAGLGQGHSMVWLQVSAWPGPASEGWVTTVRSQACCPASGLRQLPLEGLSGHHSGGLPDVGLRARGPAQGAQRGQSGAEGSTTWVGVHGRVYPCVGLDLWVGARICDMHAWVCIYTCGCVCTCVTVIVCTHCCLALKPAESRLTLGHPPAALRRRAAL